MLFRGTHEHTRSDSGPESVVQELRKQSASGSGTLYIELGSPQENCELNSVDS
jgi:hypothetical protein